MGTQAYSSPAQLQEQLDVLLAARRAQPALQSDKIRYVVRALQNWRQSAVRLSREGLGVSLECANKFNSVACSAGMAEVAQLNSSHIASGQPALDAAAQDQTGAADDDLTCCVCCVSTELGELSACEHSICKGLSNVCIQPEPFTLC